MIHKSLAKMKYNKSALAGKAIKGFDGVVQKAQEPFKKIKGFEDWFYTGGSLDFGHAPHKK